jgi:hypothetical protein
MLISRIRGPCFTFREIKDYADSLYGRLVAESSRMVTSARAELSSLSTRACGRGIS